MEHLKEARGLGASRYTTNIAALVPSLDERIAWVEGDHAGAARMLRSRTGANWTEAVWALIWVMGKGGVA